MKTKHIAFYFALSIATTASAQCTVGIPTHALVISTSGTLMAGGDVVWVCEGASVTDMGGADTIYLEKNCICVSNGGGAVIFAKTGCHVTLNGGSEQVIYEAGVNISNMGGASQFTSCSTLVYNYTKAPAVGCTASGINERVKHKVLSVYPNPASDVLNIELFSWEKYSSANIKVTNPLGSIVYSAPINFNLGESKIDVSNFSPGIYSLLVSDAAHSYSSLFIVK